MSPNRQKYEVSYKPYYVGLLFLGGAIIWLFYYGYTFEDIYVWMTSLLRSKKALTVSAVILALVGISHAILSSLKKNIDSYGSKSPMDIHVWITSTFAALGTGFIAFTSLKVFCGILGEASCDIPFLKTKDGLVLWPFMAIAFLALFYCALKIGTIVSEIFDLGRLLFHSKTEESRPVNDREEDS